MIPRSKQGAELAMNIIIIAAMGLLVLAVIIFIFGKNASSFSKGVSTCESIGGQCESDSCLSLSPPRPSIAGECTVPEGSPTKFCCAKTFT
ncbi:MAG TPA: hypothetical protein VKE88_03295 [Candidatus Nanoarchaeia archaeon]|nr:hypothetical protein [Candidatus Nanoarchaeia archaeon]